MAESRTSVNERDIFLEAPPRPAYGKKTLVAGASVILLLLWSFQGAKIRPGELIEGIPQIVTTLGRMLPPDFDKIVEQKNYYVPDELTLTELFLPWPLANDREQARERWWNNTFPQTVIGARLEAHHQGFAGRVVGLVAAGAVG